MTTTDRHDPEMEQRMHHIRSLRRHAVWLERLAASVGAAGAAIAVVVALPEPWSIVPALLGLLGALTLWALLRALALTLHVRADEAAAAADQPGQA